MEGFNIMKYDFDLSLDEHTSVGKIVAQIKDNSSVLEFGPGNGRMTRYLIDEKKCEVSIVEFDRELFENVMQYAHAGFLGDIEKYDWLQRFEGKKFDYIIFADVLEHLSNPELTLKKVIPFLATEGKLLISFPNLAHNSVLIDLFNNKLNWNQYGLLDKTHNTFYTQSGFEALFERLGLKIAIEDYTYSQVGQNEINAFYEDLPINSQYDFKNRLFGEVYQYFYVLQTAPVTNVIRNTPENSNFVKHVRLEYSYLTSTEVKQSELLLNNYTGEGKTQTLSIADKLQFLKIFPSNAPSIVYFKALDNGKEIRKIDTNAVWSNENIYIFQDANGYFKIDGNFINQENLMVNFDFIYEGEYPVIQERLIEFIKKQNKEVEKLQNDLLKIKQENNLKQEIMFQRFNEVSKRVSSSKWFDNKSTSKAEREKLITIKIETIENNEELNTAIVKGWGYSNLTKEPLRYDIQSNEGAYFKVTPLNRQDVIEICDLPEGNKYGFIIEIENYQIEKYLHLIISTANNEKIYMKINRFNLSEANVMQRTRYLIGSVRQKGILGTIKAYKERRKQQDWYDNWIIENESLDRETITTEIENWSFQPKISIVVPVYNVEEKWLKICIESLQNQLYSNWELCIADDASTEEYIKPFLEKVMQEDSRIKVVFREKNGHISEATNSALGIATGEYIGFMDNDDELAPNALYEVVKVLNEDQTIDFIYTDEDKIDIRGKRFDPFF
jgi:SAM-dependent methyltransferase